MTRPELAVGAIAMHEGAVLLVRRVHEPGAGLWSVPGGRVEAGESLVAALQREVHEETGLEIRVGELAGWVERISTDHHFVILDFFVEIIGVAVPVAGDDVDRAAWVQLAQLHEFDLVEGLDTFLRSAGLEPG